MIGNNWDACDLYHSGSTSALSTVNEEKELCVTMDHTFRKDITDHTNNANRIIGPIRTIIHLDKDIFKTMARLHLEYAATIKSPALKKDVAFIESVQDRQ